jgi:hypothetical protein
MSTSFTNLLGTFTSIAFTSTSLSALASANYVTSTNPVDLGSTTPLDCLLELSVTPGTVSGNKQAVVFMQVSLDGSNYSSGPTSGTTTTDEPDLYFVGVLPLITNSGAQKKSFSLVKSEFGACPRYFKPVIKNDSGAAFAAGTLNYVPVTGVGT